IYWIQKKVHKQNLYLFLFTQRKLNDYQQGDSAMSRTTRRVFFQSLENGLGSDIFDGLWLKHFCCINTIDLCKII
ncbi:MAG: hypothetical protein SAJ11_18925, partial [Jaaginema sp. PMC 1078.18]|nr:hypothetical protein [Jaaginema sp. PMC 1078.18]